MGFTWKQLKPSPCPEKGSPCTRSSHGISVVETACGKQLLVLYGGEHVARTPIENSDSCWILDLETNAWKWIDTSSGGPPERVAHAQAVHDGSVYIFGGRAGITMEEKAMNDIWKLDPVAGTWAKVECNGDLPEARSFHRMICVDDSLWVFGGCGPSGRLNDLYRFDIPSRTWHALPASTLRGRGGPNFIPMAAGTKLGVVAGFAGEETNDGQLFDIAQSTWSEGLMAEELKSMRPRSVCVAGALPSQGSVVIFGGEVDPSDRGHEGAGGFTDDLVFLNEASGAVIKTETRKDGMEWPGVRGWSAGATSEKKGGGQSSLFVFGGLAGDDKDPVRLDDLWRLDVQK